MHNKKPLIIIDMQYEFDAQHLDQVIKGVVAEIQLAKKTKRPIIVVEYDNHNETIKNLWDEIGDYPHVETVTKMYDDGSLELKEYWDSIGRTPKIIRICGINATCCVYQTINGLRKQYPNMFIEIPIRACGNQWHGRFKNESPYNRYPLHNNTKLIRREAILA